MYEGFVAWTCLSHAWDVSNPPETYRIGEKNKLFMKLIILDTSRATYWEDQCLVISTWKKQRFLFYFFFVWCIFCLALVHWSLSLIFKTSLLSNLKSVKPGSVNEYKSSFCLLSVTLSFLGFFFLFFIREPFQPARMGYRWMEILLEAICLLRISHTGLLSWILQTL